MKSIFMLISFFFSVSLFSQTINVMTYNIRYDNPNDNENAWTKGERKTKAIQLIKHENPDVFGVQEALHHQVVFLEKAFPDYTRVGVGRDDGKQGGEYVAIFFNTKKFQLIDSGYFWLSETPETPSKGWDAQCCNRITTWVKLRYKKTDFYVFNTHFDHEGKIAQVESASLLVKKLTPLIKVAPVILLGDFNVTPDSEAIKNLQTILKDTYRPYTNIPKGTFTGFDLEKTPMHRIDYIFTNKPLKTKNFKILNEKIKGLYPSDHFPVYVKVKF